MNLTETLRLAFSTIWAHRLRSFLTLLGMIIGIAAFMIIFSLVQGFTAYIDEKIVKIGSNAFTIGQFSLEDYKDREAQRRNKKLTMDELDFIKEKSQLVDKIGAKVSGVSVAIKYGNKSIYNVNVSGAESVIADIDNLDIAEGRYFTDAENNNATRVAYIGTDIVNNLFPEGTALGQEIKIRGFSYRVIGVQTTQGTVFGQPMDSFVHLPLKTFDSDIGSLKNTYPLNFMATAKSDQLFDETVEEVRTLLRIKRRIPTNEKDNFGIYTPDAIAGIKNRLLGPIFVVVLAVPGVALVVGAIVIMNIMLVSVTERTKEIGIRKSLGAKSYDIMRQFLFEAVALSTIGGIVGLIMAEFFAYILTIFVFQTRIPIWSALIAIMVSGMVGVAAGLLPAWKAAQLDPIEALRAE